MNEQKKYPRKSYSNPLLQKHEVLKIYKMNARERERPIAETNRMKKCTQLHTRTSAHFANYICVWWLYLVEIHRHRNTDTATDTPSSIFMHTRTFIKC